jgi:drug/metabolite transporter (DMT)-like permease
MRRPSTVEVMLLTTIVLWSLNLTVSRTILTHGFQPLAYASVRYGLAVLVFVALTLGIERSLRIERRDLPLVAGAAAFVFVNQIAFVYALDKASASVLGLVLGATPIFAALAGLAFRTETLPPRFWAGALLSFAGVALVALGAGGKVSGDLGGVVLGVLTAATWAGYSILVAQLMRRYSATRISAVVIGSAWVLIALASVPQLSSQDWDLGWEIWALLLFATLGPLVLTNELWFRSLDRIGPARATLAANLQPFLAAAIAVALLSETLDLLELAGGVLIAAGIAVARRRGAAASVAVPPAE